MAIFVTQNQKLIAQRIEREMANKFNIKVADLYSKSREDHIVKVRFMVWYILKTNHKMSSSIIGRIYGRDSASVLNGLLKVKELGLEKAIPKNTLSTYPQG